jgi:hypothetical protein
MNVQDKYARSITTSHLEVTEFVGDVDAIIAAGWINESLATLLWRLRVEFDSVDKRATKGNSTMTDRLLALVHMRSLKPAKDALGSFVAGAANRRGLNLNPIESGRMSARILNHFLDPLCPVCHGRKYKEVPGTGRLSAIPCGACEGSGRHKLRFEGGTSHDEERFTNAVLGELDQKMNHVAGLMGRFMRDRVEAV